ncbi:hypothetical protein [Pseudomonas sp. MWU16-30323]|uniref:hypothetical protein n=1 Tax=Pseudomonas sp. MWU16-30323 TaxID=2878094 RepID=UPI001CFB1783|nr:hypothetical protein [Pseudomonas sp. MWU16-30323]
MSVDVRNIHPFQTFSQMAPAPETEGALPPASGHSQTPGSRNIARFQTFEQMAQTLTTPPQETASEKNTAYAPAQATGRPSGDRRTADQIIKANPVFKNLPASIPLADVFRHTGDWTPDNPDPDKRADAAYNAARLLNYIDDNPKEPTKNPIRFLGNSEIDGEILSPLPPPFDETYLLPGSEADLLKKFSTDGYSALPDHGTPLATDNEKNTTREPTAPSGRPFGDTRSAQQILSANPVVQLFVEHIKSLPYGQWHLDELKQQIGDWTEKNTDPDSRADAAYNFAQVGNYLHPGTPGSGASALDKNQWRKETERYGTVLNSEAHTLLRFIRLGYSALRE